MPRRHSWGDSGLDLHNLDYAAAEPLLDNDGEDGDTVAEHEEHPSSSRGQLEDADDVDAARIQHARMQGAVYVTGRSNISPRHDSSWLRRSV